MHGIAPVPCFHPLRLLVDFYTAVPSLFCWRRCSHTGCAGRVRVVAAVVLVVSAGSVSVVVLAAVVLTVAASVVVAALMLPPPCWRLSPCAVSALAAAGAAVLLVVLCPLPRPCRYCGGCCAVRA